jgi:hypothetical protein
VDLNREGDSPARRSAPSEASPAFREAWKKARCSEGGASTPHMANASISETCCCPGRSDSTCSHACRVMPNTRSEAGASPSRSKEAVNAPTPCMLMLCSRSWYPAKHSSSSGGLEGGQARLSCSGRQKTSAWWFSTPRDAPLYFSAAVLTSALQICTRLSATEMSAALVRASGPSDSGADSARNSSRV